MKSYSLAIAVLLSCVGAFAQGQVVFANRVGAAGLDAPVYYHGTQHGPGPDYTAQLMLVNGISLTPLATSPFQAAGPGAAAIRDRYWSAVTVDVPGVLPGQSAMFRVREWRTSAGSYDATWDKGESADFVVTVGGGVNPPANLVGLQGFNLVLIPEPSTWVLGVVGGVALLWWRRGSRKT